MFGILLTLLLLDGILLIVVVLLQSGKGGGLAAMGGGTSTDMFMGSRQAANVLTKSTWATAAVFLGLSIILSVMSTHRQNPTPLLQQEFQGQTAPAQPQPLVPGAGEAPASGTGEAVPGVPAGGAQSQNPTGQNPQGGGTGPGN